jgi:hypothetical protein
MEDYEKPTGVMIDFLKELSTLLEKYKIEITAADEWGGYAECGEDIQIRVETDGTETFFSIPFGKYLSKESIQESLND